MFWKNRKENGPGDFGWKVFRTKPVRESDGFAVPTFIHNGSYHLSKIEVYEDGAIDCWGFLDLDLFRKKAKSGWVATKPTPGERVSIFNLGSAEVVDAKWRCETRNIITAVEAVLRQLNPSQAGLLDMEGDDTEVRNGVRHAKLGLSDSKPCRLGNDNHRIPGAELPVLQRADGEYVLSQWFLFADGRTRIGNASDWISVEEVESMFEAGQLALSVPDGSWVSIPPFGCFKTKNGYWGVKATERVREGLDEMGKLRGGEGAIHRCIAAHQAYCDDSSDEMRETLRGAYEAVPEHLRMYCGDMDSKDWPIRRILYGEVDS